MNLFDSGSVIIFKNEPFIRLGFFFGILFVICFWELVKPRRKLASNRLIRWPSNFGIVVLNTVLLRVLLPFTAVSVAVLAQKYEWGVFNIFEFPFFLSLLISIVFLDLVIYCQHVMFHAVPLLWRVHRMHHADLDFDVTTGSRFHPIEIFLSMGIKVSAVVLLGAPPLAVLIFEVLLNGVAMFNHGNILVPSRVDQILRYFIVTPDMHRVHHSIDWKETNSNFGFNLPWWDRLFGTYKDQPDQGHQNMTIGIYAFRDKKYLKFWWLLSEPFLKEEKHIVKKSK